MDGGNEAVPLARHGLNKARVFGVILQCRAKLLERGVEASIEVYMRALWPESAPKLFSRNNLAALTQQQLQNAKRLLLNPQPNALPS
jgi:hypothetical protein